MTNAELVRRECYSALRFAKLALIAGKRDCAKWWLREARLYATRHEDWQAFGVANRTLARMNGEHI